MKLIQSKSVFKIGQVCVAGSTGKKTTIFTSDVDCVLFINDMSPPFKEVLDDIHDILSLADSYKISDVRLTKYSIQFKANDLDFDLLPAANFAVNCYGNGDQLIDEQHRKTLDFIKRDPKKFGYLFSGSLAKATVQFMKQQDGFVNEMVRLSKFWYKTLYFQEYVSGAKSSIELIAVYAAMKERNYDSLSHLRCFGQFLKYLMKFDELNIVFENEYKFPEHQVLDNGRPRIMDPVNPYNNFAQNWSEKSIELIKAYANETYRRLQILANGCIIQLNVLFVPQPMHLPSLIDAFPNNKSCSQWLIGCYDYNLLADLKIRNNKLMADFRFRNALEILKNYFRFMAYSVMASPNCSATEMQKSVQDLISSHVLNEKKSWVTAIDEKHEDFDVTFTIPFSKEKAIRISYRL